MTAATLCHRCRTAQGLHHFFGPNDELLLTCEGCLTNGESVVVALHSAVGATP